MMSTRTPKTGRLLLAAACGLALVTQGEAGERVTEPSPDEQRNVQNQLDALYRERGLVRNDAPEPPRRLEIAANDAPPTAEVAPAPSVETTGDAVPNEIPVRSAPRKMRRNAGRSNMGRFRRSTSSPRPARPTLPVPELGDEAKPLQKPAPVSAVRSPEPEGDAAVAPVTGAKPTGPAPVAEARQSGDTTPQPLPEAAPKPAPRRGFVLFGRRKDESKTEKRSFLSRIFNRGRQSDDEVEIASPAKDGETGETMVAGEGGSLPEPSAPTELPEPTDAADLVELPAPTDERPVDAVVETSDTPEESIATSEPESKPIPEELDNPFPELSESEADAPADEPIAGTDRQSNDNPFEVEPMPEPVASKSDTPAAEPAVDDAPTDENPFAAPAPAEKVAVEEKGTDEQPMIRPRKVADNPASKPAPEVDVDPRIKRIREREGRSGLKGFCPVALRDDRQLVDSDESYTVVHKSRTYTLSSKEAVRKFETDPQKYAPVASGHDVILLTVEGRRVEGSLDHAVWYKDRLHLFSNRETLSRFVRSLNRDPFAGSGTRPASNEVPAKETKPAAEPAGDSGPRIQLPAPLPKDESPAEEKNPFEFDN